MEGKQDHKQHQQLWHNISTANKEPSTKIIPGDTNKPKIINDGKEWNDEELELLKMKKAKDLGKKNEGKEYNKLCVITDKYGDNTFGNPILKDRRITYFGI